MLPEQQVGNDARIIQYTMNDLNTKSLKTPLETLQILTCVTTKAHEAHGFLIRYLVLMFILLPGTPHFTIIVLTTHHNFL
jgi:hypothetical protein